MVQNLNICCPRGHCLLNNIASKVQTQKTSAKNSCLKKPKAKNLKSVLPHTNMAKFLEPEKKNKKNRKDKKKKFQEKKE